MEEKIIRKWVIARKNYFKNWRKYLSEVKKIAREYFGENFKEMVVFGSVAKGNFSVGLSDIDVAIVLKEKVSNEKRIEFIELIFRKFPDSPFEFHVVDEKVWKGWYLRFIGEKEKILI